MSTGTSRVPSVTERKDLSFVIAPEIRIAVQDWLESTAMPLVKDSIQRTSSKKLAEQIEQMSVKVIVHLILLLGTGTRTKPRQFPSFDTIKCRSRNTTVR